LSASQLAPSNHGTTLDNLTNLANPLGLAGEINGALGSVCAACVEQERGSAFLPAAANVTNITVQKQCVLDASDHLEIAADPIALADMLNALDPAAPCTSPAWSCCRSPVPPARCQACNSQFPAARSRRAAGTVRCTATGKTTGPGQGSWSRSS